MWIKNKKIDLQELVKDIGLISKMEKVPNMRGLGDSSILKCTFESGNVYEVEFMPNEYKIILKCRK